MDARAVSARAVVLVVLAGCGDNLGPQLPPLPPVPQLDNARFPAEPKPALDLLLLVDNSASTYAYQLALGTSFGAFLGVLDQLDELPSLHIGVATSDLGTSVTDSDVRPPSVGTAGNGGCLNNGGDDGLFRTYGLHAGETFVTYESGVVNADVSLEQEIAQLVKVGAGGCGFEQHLGGMRRALSNPANGAFLRPDGNLAIVIIGDEDDCSVRDAALFDSQDQTLGPLSSFRCTRGGLTCNEDVDTPGVKTGCHSQVDSKYVEDVSTYIDFVAGLEPDRRQIMTAAIVGDPSKVEVEMLPLNGNMGAVPTLVHSCQYVPDAIGLAVADPAVRDAQFVTSLGGPVESVCQKDLAPQLTEIGHAVKRLVGDPCLTGDTSGACTVTDEYADGQRVDLSPCPADGDCYELVADAKACPDTADHRRVTIRRLAPPPLGTFVAVRCEATRP